MLWLEIVLFSVAIAYLLIRKWLNKDLGDDVNAHLLAILGEHKARLKSLKKELISTNGSRQC